MAEALEWQIEEAGNTAVIALSGRVDESTADQFKECLIDVASKGHERVVLDLQGIDYMSSRGLRAVTLAQRAADKHGCTFVLARPNDTMREILQISRYDLIFRVTDTIEEARDG